MSYGCSVNAVQTIVVIMIAILVMAAVWLLMTFLIAPQHTEEKQSPGAEPEVEPLTLRARPRQYQRRLFD